LRKNLLPFLLILSLLAACLPGAPRPLTPAPLPTLAAPDNRPNILLILTDDQDMASLAYMPKVKVLLADQGVQFSRFFVNVPLCCPSRSNILLGQYSHNSHILTNARTNGGFQKFYQLGLEARTIAVALQDHGYYTALLGKYLNGYPKTVEKTHVPPGWSEWYVPASGNPYRNFNYTLNENGRLVKYGDKAEDYLTDVLAARGVDFIQRTAASGQPFFLFISTYAPHTPAIPAPRHAALFTEAVAPRDGSFNEADVSDKPEYVRNHAPRSPQDMAEIDALYVKRLQSLQAVDDLVEQVVNALQATGELENTYIFFTSDNGFHLGQHRMMPGKQLPYEEDIRVPFIVRGPGVPAGQTRDEIAGNVDLASTFGEIAGLPSRADWDGRSLLSLLHGAPTPSDWRGAYLIQRWKAKVEDDEESNSQDGSFFSMDVIIRRARGYGVLEPPDLGDLAAAQAVEVLVYRGLRTSDYLYVEYGTGERELYDLRVDPYEMDNLALTADPQLLQRLSDWLARLAVCSGEECRQ
jgi:arylsulfatase A-like enzyme